MALTAEEILHRRERIGASDIPVILGLSRFKTARELLAEKRSKETPLPSEDSEVSSWGHRLEPIILHRWADVQGYKFGREVTHWGLGPTSHAAFPWATCSPDGWCSAVPGGFGVECKNRAYEGGWGPSGSQEIPPDVEAQVRWSMLVTERPMWAVAVLLGGNQFRHYLIERDEKWEEWVFPIVEAFRAGETLEDSLWKPLTAGSMIRDATVAEQDYMHRLALCRRQEGELKRECQRLEGLIRDAIGTDKGIQSHLYVATQTPTKGRTTTDWEAVAKRACKDYRASPLYVEEIVKAATKEGKPYRRLSLRAKSYVTTTPEEENDD